MGIIENINSFYLCTMTLFIRSDIYQQIITLWCSWCGGIMVVVWGGGVMVVVWYGVVAYIPIIEPPQLTMLNSVLDWIVSKK